MNAMISCLEEHDLDYQVAFRKQQMQAKPKRHSAARGRRRGKDAALFNGVHRRRDKRNWL